VQNVFNFPSAFLVNRLRPLSFHSFIARIMIHGAPDDVMHLDQCKIEALV
jgi:hypothetical protein